MPQSDAPFRPLAVVERTTGRCFTADSEAELTAIKCRFGKSGGAPAVAFIVVDLKAAQARVKALTKGKTRFSLGEIAKLCRVSYAISWAWLNEGIIVASIRGSQGPGGGERRLIFSDGDAFGASVIAAFHAAGCDRPTLERLSREIVFRNRSESSEASSAETAPALAYTEGATT
ncbi:MAG TPA: hypothetical protein VGN57_14125 [Pirellulaceae bacterium]|jgi:hypothetical protein|nr:hypothetical protein [Pirellulaceae bacterium]